MWDEVHVVETHCLGVAENHTAIQQLTTIESSPVVGLFEDDSGRIETPQALRQVAQLRLKLRRAIGNSRLLPVWDQHREQRHFVRLAHCGRGPVPLIRVARELTKTQSKEKWNSIRSRARVRWPTVSV